MKTMKNFFFPITLFVTLAIAGLLFTAGCDNTAKKDEPAPAVKTDTPPKSEKEIKEAEWQAFKADMKTRITANETRIKELRDTMKKPESVFGKAFMNRVALLEKQNKDMITKMDDYEKSQSDWVAFKKEFSHDMDGLGQALKDFMTDSKKK